MFLYKSSNNGAGYCNILIGTFIEFCDILYVELFVPKDDQHASCFCITENAYMYSSMWYVQSAVFCKQKIMNFDMLTCSWYQLVCAKSLSKETDHF